MPELRDSYNRRIDYLRISVTDRCNLRCVYCMPPQGVDWRPRSEILSYDEILRVVEAAAALGIRKVRLTGGEPLVRRDLTYLVEGIARIPGIQEISLTTNGLLLARLAQPLAEAGLRRVNVSLDTLDPDKFHRMTRFGDIERVWRGINAAEQAHLTPIKINSVVIRGVNDDELLALSRLTIEHDWHVRFIELMPVGDQADWGESYPASADRYFPVWEMFDRLASLELVVADQPIGNGPARTFRIPGARGTVGFISPLGDHFCATCNRLRLTADGQLRPCLLAENEVDVREVVRQRGDLTSRILQAVHFKPSSHNLLNGPALTKQNRMMCQIGG